MQLKADGYNEQGNSSRKEQKCVENNGGNNTQFKPITLHSTSDIHQPELRAQKLKENPSKYSPIFALHFRSY